MPNFPISHHALSKKRAVRLRWKRERENQRPMRRWRLERPPTRRLLSPADDELASDQAKDNGEENETKGKIIKHRAGSFPAVQFLG